MLGPKVLVFGGQVEGFFFNDLVAFDLNTLTHAQPRWELINPVEGNEPPPARTNHVAITHNDKLYIFGGTNGVDWFNDIWRFDPVVRTWTMLRCSGFVPEAREGHSASLVGDVIYVFGGRDLDGSDLGDLVAFKISTSRWFTFQNMGPGPSPRSGHALCTVGKRIFVVGGQGVSNRGDEQNISILDTAKIKFPAETNTGNNVNESVPNDIKKSSTNGSPTPRAPMGETRATNPSIRSVSGQSTTSVSRLPHSSIQLQKPPTRDFPQYQQTRRISQLDELRGNMRPQRESQFRGPPPASLPQRISSQPALFSERKSEPSSRNLSLDNQELKRSGSLDSMMDNNEANQNQAPPNKDNLDKAELADRNNRLGKVRSLEELKRSRQPKIDAVIDEKPSNTEAELAPALRHMNSGHIETLVQQAQPETQPRAEPRLENRPSSARLEITEVKSPDSAKLAWLEAELKLARKAGYTITDASQNSEDNDQDTSNIQALVSMRTELMSLRSTIEEAKTDAQEQILRAVAERNVALKELAYEKARSNAIATMNPSLLKTVETQRTRKLEMSLLEHANRAQSHERQIFALQSELAASKRTREHHEELVDRHSKAAADAEQKHLVLLQDHSTVSSSLAELRDSLNDHQTRRIAAESALSANQIDITKLRELEDRHEKHIHAFEVSNAATAAATSRASIAEVQLDQERQRSAALGDQVSQLRAELESARSHLEEQTKLREDSSRTLEATRSEAESARAAMTAGIAELISHYRSAGPHDQAQHQATLDQLNLDLAETKSMHEKSRNLSDTHQKDVVELKKKVQLLNDSHTESTNSTLVLQRRLTASQSDYQDLQAKHNILTEALATKEFELTESQLKFASLQQIISSKQPRRDSPEKRKSRNLNSPQSFNGRGSQTPDASRMRELEQRLAESAQLQREMHESHEKNTAEIAALSKRHQESIARQEEAEKRAKSLEEELGRSPSSLSNGEMQSPGGLRRTDSLLRNPNKEAQLAQARAIEAEKQLSESTQNYKERLGQLEADYQSAVHYVKGTEKMLRRMKEELGKYKSANASLMAQLEEASSQTDQRSVDSLKAHHEERSRDLETRLASLASEKETMSTELSDIRLQLKTSTTQHTEKVASLESQIAELRHTTGATGSATKLKQLEFDLSEAQLNAQRLGFENRDLERRKNESEAKVKMLLDQFEQSVDSYRRQSTLLVSPTSEHPPATNGTRHERDTSSEYGGDHHMSPPLVNGSSFQQRTSSALDLLANELDQLRNHWESSARATSLSSITQLQTPEMGSAFEAAPIAREHPPSSPIP